MERTLIQASISSVARQLRPALLAAARLKCSCSHFADSHQPVASDVLSEHVWHLCGHQLAAEISKTSALEIGQASSFPIQLRSSADPTHRADADILDSLAQPAG